MIKINKKVIDKFDWVPARKKPIVVYVVRIDEEFMVETKEGMMKGKKGDYLVRGVSGELYPIDKEIFDLTYDLEFK